MTFLLADNFGWTEDDIKKIPAHRARMYVKKIHEKKKEQPVCPLMNLGRRK